MKLPATMAKKLLRLVAGESIPGSLKERPPLNRMVEEGVLTVKTIGRSKKHLSARNSGNLCNYVKNHFGIDDLQQYVEKLKQDDLSRSEAIRIASNSKVKRIRTFTGFPVNCYQPVKATLNNRQIVIEPLEGRFTFVHDFTQFVPSADITIVGIENVDNFKYVAKQAYLFEDCKPLFVSRYPQSKDLINWLQSIPNDYLHFGDFDFAGIKLYHNEFKKHLKERAVFFIPVNIEEILLQYGKRELYNDQVSGAKIENISEQPILTLLTLIHKYRKCLEQEIFIEHLKNYHRLVL